MNACDVSELDADALLPPRKRLLAGLKRQGSDINFPIPSTSSSVGSEFDARLIHHLRSQLSNPNMSIEEIVEASRHAASVAAKNAVVARVNAEDKATKAAKAVAAAKSALDLVATLTEAASKKVKRLKRNKSKKHMAVESLYDKNKRKTVSRADEELARNLHRSINSSPRISKNFSGSDLKSRHKRLKSSASLKKTSIIGGDPIGEGNRPAMLTGKRNGIIEDVDSKAPVSERDMLTVDLNTSKSEKVALLSLNQEEERRSNKTDWTKMKNGEVDGLHSKDNTADSSESLCRKRGRVKQKKLPLSICSFRDQTGPNELLQTIDMPQLEGNSGRAAVGNQSLFPDSSSKWKCQAFKAATMVEQNKVMQS